MPLNHAALAAELHRARTERREIEALTDRAEISIEDAYAIQAEGVRLREAEGERVIGGKLGFTSEAMRRAMGVDEPNYGWLTDAMALADGTVALDRFIHPKAEPEIAFLLDADLGPDASADDVLEATAGVAVCLEIVDSRYRDFVFRAADNVADDSSAAAFVVGTSLSRPFAGLADVGVVLTVNGELADTAAGGAVMPDPASAVAWMARATLAAGTRGLRRGDLVLSGGLTAPVALERGMTVTVEIDRIGSASLRVR
ncbi:MAG TPA: fumarylacetoacetate hydrolase family protein [Actinomycetota bacterium]|nr:fumarylacetoacetate hydrolase family protein [Actinomycetota bacterium]